MFLTSIQGNPNRLFLLKCSFFLPQKQRRVYLLGFSLGGGFTSLPSLSIIAVLNPLSPTPEFKFFFVIVRGLKSEGLKREYGDLIWFSCIFGGV